MGELIVCQSLRCPSSERLSSTTGQSISNFIWKHQKVGGVNVYSNGHSHMIELTATPTNTKVPSKLFSELKMAMPLR